MSDSGSDVVDSTDDAPSGPNRGLIAAAVLVAVGVAVAVVLVVGGDDESTDTSTPAATTTLVATEEAAPQATDAPPATASAESPAATEPGPTELAFSIGGIDDGGSIPIEFTCDGDNVAPTVVIDAIPDGVLQLAMVVDDPDAPTQDPFVHWVVYDIPGTSTGFSDGDPALTYGPNDIDVAEWFGPCPPEGDGPHRYVFTLYGLDREPAVDPGLNGRDLVTAIDGSIVAESALTATYARASS